MADLTRVPRGSIMPMSPTLRVHAEPFAAVGRPWFSLARFILERGRMMRSTHIMSLIYGRPLDIYIQYLPRRVEYAMPRIFLFNG